MAQATDKRKVKAAQKIARAKLHEARKLCKRGRSRLSDATRLQIEETIEQLAEHIEVKNLAGIEQQTVVLDGLVHKHLVPFRKPAWRESVESIGLAVLVALMIRAFVVEAFKIPSGSMIPTLAIGDQIFVNKYLYGIRVPFTSIRLVDFAMPQRGEVIVFIYPGEPHEDYIKRVIGLPGDEIMVIEDTVYVNGKPLERVPLGKRVFWDRDTQRQRLGALAQSPAGHLPASPGDGWYAFEAFAFKEKHGEHDYVVLQDTRSEMHGSNYGPQIVPAGHVFVMGDNRDHSADSRAWGAVPLSNILGRSMFVWWSWGQDGLATDRLGTWIE